MQQPKFLFVLAFANYPVLGCNKLPVIFPFHDDVADNVYRECQYPRDRVGIVYGLNGMPLIELKDCSKPNKPEYAGTHQGYYCGHCGVTKAS